MPDQADKAKEIKLQNEATWFDLKGVISIGLGKVDGEIGIIITVEQNIREIQTLIPSSIEGIPIKIQQTKPYRAL